MRNVLAHQVQKVFNFASNTLDSLQTKCQRFFASASNMSLLKAAVCEHLRSSTSTALDRSCGCGCRRRRRFDFLWKGAPASVATAAVDPHKVSGATAIAHRPEHGRLAVALIFREARSLPLVCSSKAPPAQKIGCSSSAQTGLPYRGRQGLRGVIETALRAPWRATPSPKKG